MPSKTMLLLFAILILLLIAAFPVCAVIIGARAEKRMRKIIDNEKGE